MPDSVSQNEDGSTRITKTMENTGQMFLTRQSIDAIHLSGPDGTEVLLRNGKLAIMTIHQRGQSVREIVIAMGSGDGATVFKGSPEAAEQLVQQLQLCISRARALTQGGGIA